jgi:hypothetical protein
MKPKRKKNQSKNKIKPDAPSPTSNTIISKTAVDNITSDSTYHGDKDKMELGQVC